ncbi:MAG: hypothetical protein H6843_13925 [Rhodospirillaceae bacterium]|nr:hypothetical protein [Rhodospirillaceae bacterium]
MDDLTQIPMVPPLPALDGLDDQALHDVIARAKAALDKRQAERRKQALSEIKRLAREHGLNVNVDKPKSRRGHGKQ